MDNFKEAFRDEALELLNRLESTLLELEADPEDTEQIMSVFRTMHTIKGSAGMFGFDHIGGFAHTLETSLEDVKSGSIPFSPELASLTLAARDHIRELLDAPEPPPDDLASYSAILSQKFQAAVAPGGTDQKQASQPARSAGGQNAPASGMLVTYRIHFMPKPDIYLNGTNPVLLLQELSELGLYSAVPYLDQIPPLSEMDPERCYIGWFVFLTTTAPVEQVRDVFMFVEDSAEIEIQIIENLDDAVEEQGYKRIGQILSERGVIDAMMAERAAQTQRRIGEIFVDEGVSESDVQSALTEQEHVRKSRERFQSELSSSSIRVSSDKLDHLVDLVGELVTLQARLSSTVAKAEEPEVVSISENLERLVDELRDRTMSVRMVPVGSTFSRFRRLVRDLSADMGKSVELVTDGGETELDKTVIERLNDPLVHLVRNAVDHGIEAPSQRLEAGKAKTAQVTLGARHVGATVVISVKDDGAGINTARVREKALERGLISEEDVLSDEAIYDLLFHAGFSTAQAVTEVSGRGVGMDVVKRQVEAFGGSIRVQSIPGQGSEFSLVIPLTLAIIDGLLVRLGDNHYVFPLSSVSECIELHDSGEQQKRDSYISNRGEVLPYIHLRDVFKVQGERPEYEQIVVVQLADGPVGMVVDAVLGDHQTVIKDLGRMFRAVEGVSGATILGDGSVALVLDLARLGRIAIREGSDRVHSTTER